MFTGYYAETGDAFTAGKASLKAGGYLSVSLGDPPAVADVGLRGEASVSRDSSLPGSNDNIGVSKSNEVKASVQLGIENGLDVDVSTSTKYGVKLKGFLK